MGTGSPRSSLAAYCLPSSASTARSAQGQGAGGGEGGGHGRGQPHGAGARRSIGKPLAPPTAESSAAHRPRSASERPNTPLPLTDASKGPLADAPAEPVPLGVRRRRRSCDRGGEAKNNRVGLGNAWRRGPRRTPKRADAAPECTPGPGSSPGSTSRMLTHLVWSAAPRVRGQRQSAGRRTFDLAEFLASRAIRQERLSNRPVVGRAAASDPRRSAALEGGAIFATRAVTTGAPGSVGAVCEARYTND